MITVVMLISRAAALSWESSTLVLPLGEPSMEALAAVLVLTYFRQYHVLLSYQYKGHTLAPSCSTLMESRRNSSVRLCLGWFAELDLAQESRIADSDAVNLA